MNLKALTSWSYLLALLSIVTLAPATAIAASPVVETAIKALGLIPADATKFESYCKVLGEMSSVPDGDEAKYDALEDQLEQIIESYGPELTKAWDVIEDIDPDTDDGKAISAAFDAIDAKCP